MAKARDWMVTTFETVSLDRIKTDQDLPETEYVVVTTGNQQPLSLLSADQLRSLRGQPVTDPSSRTLPMVPVVEEDSDLDESLEDLAPVLLDQGDLPGAVVRENGRIVGILSRKAIAEHILTSRGLAGDPVVKGARFACPRGDYEQTVAIPRDGLLCPNHRISLIRTR